MANSGCKGALPAWWEGARALALRRKTHAAATLAVAASMLAAAEHCGAADAAAGRQKALQCQPCHGLDGLAKIPGAPHIAGQVQEYLVKAMRDYRSGARKDEMMAVVMRHLSEQDIDDLAAYYAGVAIKAEGER